MTENCFTFGDYLVTEDGDFITTEASNPLVTEDFYLPGAAQVGNFYDYIAQIDIYAPGVVVQREDIDAVACAYYENNFVPLTAAQIIALVGPLPAYPTGLPRFPDSNPSPDGWSIVDGGKVVTGGFR